MKILKYEKDETNFAIVYKTKIFIYYLIVVNNKPFYYERINGKNYNKTEIILKKFFKEKNIKLIENHYDDFTLAKRCDDYAYGKKEHYLISETFGDNKKKVFYIFKNDKEIDSLKGQRHSPTFLTSYLMTKFKFPVGPLYYFYCDIFIDFIDEATRKKIRRYCDYFFNKFINYQFKDIGINFNSMINVNNNKYYAKIFSFYDKIISFKYEKILSIFNFQNDTNKKLGAIYYGCSYFSFLFFQHYIKKYEIKNSKIMINSCLFGNIFCQKFFNDSNEYIFSDYNILRKGWMFFIDKKYNQYVHLIDNKAYREKMLLTLKKIILENENANLHR